MSNRSVLYRPQVATESGWRRSALLITVLLASITAAVAVMSLSVTQLTERATAQHYLARAVNSLLEIDQFVVNAWPVLEAAGAQGDPIPLTNFPIALQLDPAGLADGPEAVADAVTAATASLVYDEGFDVLADSPQAFRFVSRGAAFDSTIGKLTSGGHAVATVGLIVSGTFALLLAMATAAQARGLSRIGLPALAIGVGAAVVWLAATLVQSALYGQAASEIDPFEADLLLLVADASSLVIRNAAIVALAAGIVVSTAVIGGGLIRLVDQRGNSGVRGGF